MCSSCACAARIVATRSSKGFENSSVGPQSGFALAKRLRIARARRRRAARSSRPRDPVRAFGELRARGTAAPLRSPTAGSDPTDGADTVGAEIQPFVAVVDLDEEDRAVRRPGEVEEVLGRVVQLASLPAPGLDDAEPVVMRLGI